MGEWAAYCLVCGEIGVNSRYCDRCRPVAAMRELICFPEVPGRPEFMRKALEKTASGGEHRDN